MNRPTIDVDELLELADEALFAGDQSEAISMLRKASAIAPLRKDIRNKLALVLEGTPLPAKPKKRSANMLVPDAAAMDADPDHFETDDLQVSSLDSISLIAKKAFDAAAVQKAKAGDATKRLTNLLQTGLGNWKSSMTPQVSPRPQLQPEDLAVENNTQSSVFRPEEELKEYLERTAVDLPLDEEVEDEPTTTRITKAAPASEKAARPRQSAKTAVKRPTDVEDVLAAGIGGFIEAMGRMDKSKIVYGVVYAGLVALFGFACFDVSRKFPELQMSGTSVNTASLAPVADVGPAESVSSEQAIANAKELVGAGKIQEAIDMLSAQLSSGRLLLNRDQIRVELASALNLQAESFLKANDLENSVNSYRKALSHLPTDSRLQLRLANALYYYGAMGSLDTAKKTGVLKEAQTWLGELVAGEPDNIQAHRLNALVQEALGNKTSAKTSWQKVKTLSPANSAILAEAKAHLK